MKTQHRAHSDHSCRQPAAPARSPRISGSARNRAAVRSGGVRCVSCGRGPRNRRRSRSRPGSTASATASLARSPIPFTSGIACRAFGAFRGGANRPAAADRGASRPARPPRFQARLNQKRGGTSWFSREAVPCCIGPVAYSEPRGRSRSICQTSPPPAPPQNRSRRS